MACSLVGNHVIYISHLSGEPAGPFFSLTMCKWYGGDCPSLRTATLLQINDHMIYYLLVLHKYIFINKELKF